MNNKDRIQLNIIFVIILIITIIIFLFKTNNNTDIIKNEKYNNTNINKEIKYNNTINKLDINALYGFFNNIGQNINKKNIKNKFTLNSDICPNKYVFSAKNIGDKNNIKLLKNNLYIFTLPYINLHDNNHIYYEEYIGNQNKIELGLQKYYVIQILNYINKGEEIYKIVDKNINNFIFLYNDILEKVKKEQLQDNVAEEKPFNKLVFSENKKDKIIIADIMINKLNDGIYTFDQYIINSKEPLEIKNKLFWEIYLKYHLGKKIDIKDIILE